MGMVDHVNIDVLGGKYFQTKDFEGNDESYVIDLDGRLHCTSITLFFIEGGTAVERKPGPVPAHGYFFMYSDDYGDIRCKFTEGRCVAIDRVHWRGNSFPWWDQYFCLAAIWNAQDGLLIEKGPLHP